MTPISLHIIDFADGPPNTDPATVEVVAADGVVKLWAPPHPRAAWRAYVVEHTDEPVAVAVAWVRPGGRATYACASCGSGHRHDRCVHTTAAVRAAGIYLEETP